MRQLSLLLPQQSPARWDVLSIAIIMRAQVTIRNQTRKP